MVLAAIGLSRSWHGHDSISRGSPQRQCRAECAWDEVQQRRLPLVPKPAVNQREVGDPEAEAIGHTRG